MTHADDKQKKINDCITSNGNLKPHINETWEDIFERYRVWNSSKVLAAHCKELREEKAKTIETLTDILKIIEPNYPMLHDENPIFLLREQLIETDKKRPRDYD